MTQKEIVKTWLSGNHYPTFILPKALAKEFGLDEPGYVVIEKTSQGLLLKKLEIE